MGLFIGSVVMWYQSSLLEKEWTVLEDERSLYMRMGKVCYKKLKIGSSCQLSGL